MADLTQRLSLIVDAAGAGAEATFKRLASSAESTSRAAKDTGSSVAAAAQRVADAKLKEADAYGRLRVEQQKLDDLNAKGNATQSQRVAAEERVASAQRRVQAASADVTKATEAQTEANRAAVESSGEVADAADTTGGSLRNLAGTVAGLVGGFSLVDWLSDSVTGFLEASRSAQGLAMSMNATVAEGGQLATLFGSLGLEADDLLEIQAEFAQTVAASADGLTALGTELQHNSDGTVNWARSLTDTLAQLQKIPDATERNRLGFEMFGEEGYKQLSRLLTSGVSVEQALERIGFPITDEDVRAVQEFDAAMMELRTSSGDLGRAIGRAVLPVLSTLVDVGMGVADVISAIPAPIALAAGAAVLFGIAMRSVATEGSFMAGALAQASSGMAVFTARAVAATGSMAAFRAAAGSAVAGAARGISGALGGPLGVAMVGVGVGVAVMSDAVDSFEGKAREAAVAAEGAEQSMGGMAASSEELGARLVDDLDALEGFVASSRGATMVMDEMGGAADGVNDATGGMMDRVLGLADSVFDLGIAEAGATAEIEAQREALGAAALQAEASQVATKGLSDLIAEGTTSGGEFAGAVRDAALAEEEQARTTDLAKAAIEAYNAVTRDAVEVTLGLMEANLSQEEGWQNLIGAFEEAAAATDDPKTAVDEVALAYIGAQQEALNYAGVAADAAVAAATAQGQIVDAASEAQIRASATVQALRDSLNAPGLTDRARADIQAMIDQLVAAQEKGDIQALLTLTGVPEAEGELDQATQDRDTTVRVESRNGPAVISYLDGIAEDRLALIRVESRNGPAVQDYLRGLAVQDRLALIRVESRNGPAVDSYLDGLTRERLAIIRVETRGGPAVDAYLDSLANQTRNARIGATRAAPTQVARAAPSGAAVYGAASNVSIGQVTLQVSTDARGRLTPQSAAEAGRSYVAAIRRYERENGTGWRR